MADPAWLKSLKKEAKEKGLDFKDLLVKYMPRPKGTDKRKTPVRKAAKGGMMKKKGYAKGGMMKKKGYMAKGGMTKKKKGYAKGGVARKKK